MLTAGGGQVSGLSGKAINKILSDYGITRSVGTESGRTSRGTINGSQQYAALLNSLYEDGLADLETVERWWVARLIDYFNSQPFVLNYDNSRTLRAMLEDLLPSSKKAA